MRKIYLSMFLCLFLGGTLQAQSYFQVQTVGTNAPYTYNSAGIDIITSGNELLSAWQTLPFAWNFYGQAVTGFYASDNGYITFDASATTSDPANASIPSVGGPNSAIYAFWDDFTVDAGSGNPDRVRTWTYGTAPNQTHCIQWWSMTPTSSTTWCYATIRIHEAGDFDIVLDYASSNAAAATSGTIGCENAAGNDATMISGSPAIAYPTLTNAGGDDIVYAFTYGSQAAYDLSITESDLTGTCAIGNNTISGEITNLGTMAVTSYDLNYRVDGGATVTTSIGSVNIAGSGGIDTYSHPTPWNVPTGGQSYTLEIWADNLNGNTDENHANDTLTENLLSTLGISAAKSVLVEEFTGAWCGFCPDGEIVLEDIQITNPNTVVVYSVHSSDDMTFNEGIRGTFGVSSYPNAMIDRKTFAGEPDAPISRSLWANYTTQRLNDDSPVSVSITQSYNDATRQLDVTVTSDFVDYAVGDLRFVYALVEDHVTGTGSGYDQVNYYDGTSGHPYFGAGDPIVGYDHRHVLRELPSGAMGNTGVMPNVANPGGNYSESFSTTLPASWDENNMHLVAYVYSYNADLTKGYIMNVTEESLAVVVGLEDENLNEVGISSVYPNPVSSYAAVAANFDEMTKASFEIYNTFGQRIAVLKEGTFTQGEHTVYFNVDQVSNGVYLVVVKTPKATYTKKITVAK